MAEHLSGVVGSLAELAQLEEYGMLHHLSGGIDCCGSSSSQLALLCNGRGAAVGHAVAGCEMH